MATTSLYTETKLIKCRLENGLRLHLFPLEMAPPPHVSPKRATMWTNQQASPLMAVQLLVQNQGFLTTVMIQELMHIDYIQPDKLRAINGASD